MIVCPREQYPKYAVVIVTFDRSPCWRQSEHLPRTSVA